MCGDVAAELRAPSSASCRRSARSRRRRRRGSCRGPGWWPAVDAASRSAARGRRTPPRRPGAPGIITARHRRLHSMEEVPFAGEHHREAELVGALDDRLVAHRAAGLHDHRDARPRPRPRRRRGTGRTRRSRTRRPRRGRRPSSPRSRPASTRFCWPAPMPTAWPSFTSTIAFDFTCPQIRQASSASAHCSAVGATLVTTRQSSRAGREVVRRPARGSRREIWR